MCVCVFPYVFLFFVCVCVCLLVLRLCLLVCARVRQVSSGQLRLTSTSRLETVNLVMAKAAIIHALKTDLLYELITGRVSTDGILRAQIDPAEPTDIWVAAARSEMTAGDVQPSDSGGRGLGTFKEQACLIISCETLRAANRTGTLWESSIVRVLKSAPRTALGRWRMRVHQPSSIAGDVLVVVLGFLGAAWDVHEIFRRQFLPTEGMVRRPFVRLIYGAERPPCHSGPQPRVADSQETTIISRHQVFPPDEPELWGPAALSQEQEFVISSIVSSDSPLHFIRALAGTGKTHLARVFLARHISKAAGFVLWVTGNRELRDDAISSAVAHGIGRVPLEEVLLMGRPADVPQLGFVEPPDVEHKMQAAEAPVYEELQALGLELEAAVQQLAAMDHQSATLAQPMPKIGTTATAQLQQVRSLAENIMRLAWEELYLGHDQRMAAILSRIRLVVCTVGLGTRLLANRGSSVGKALWRTKPLLGTFVDEAQRVPLSQMAAVAAASPILICMGDPGQEAVYPSLVSVSSVLDGLFTPKPHAEPDAEAVAQARDAPEASSAWGMKRAPQPAGSIPFLQKGAAVHHLTECWRCGWPLPEFMEQLEPVMCADFRPASATQRTNIRYLFYQSEGPQSEGQYGWWSFATLARTTRGPKIGTSEGNMVVYNRWLFQNLAAEVLSDCAAWAASGATAAQAEPVVMVLFYLQRLRVPFSFWLDMVWEHLQAGAPCARANVHVRLVSDVTGPSCWRVHVVYHRRYVDAADQFCGMQDNMNLRYIGYTRASNQLSVWIEMALTLDELPREIRPYFWYGDHTYRMPWAWPHRQETKAEVIRDFMQAICHRPREAPESTRALNRKVQELVTSLAFSGGISHLYVSHDHWERVNPACDLISRGTRDRISDRFWWVPELQQVFSGLVHSEPLGQVLQQLPRDNVLLEKDIADLLRTSQAASSQQGMKPPRLDFGVGTQPRSADDDSFH